MNKHPFELSQEDKDIIVKSIFLNAPKEEKVALAVEVTFFNRKNEDRERVLVLTDKAYHIVNYSFAIKKVLKSRRISLHKITKIQAGIVNVQDENRLSNKEDSSLHYGFKIFRLPTTRKERDALQARTFRPSLKLIRSDVPFKDISLTIVNELLVLREKKLSSKSDPGNSNQEQQIAFEEVNEIIVPPSSSGRSILDSVFRRRSTTISNNPPPIVVTNPPTTQPEKIVQSTTPAIPISSTNNQQNQIRTEDKSSSGDWRTSSIGVKSETQQPTKPVGRENRSSTISSIGRLSSSNLLPQAQKSQPIVSKTPPTTTTQSPSKSNQTSVPTDITRTRSAPLVTALTSTTFDPLSLLASESEKEKEDEPKPVGEDSDWEVVSNKPELPLPSPQRDKALVRHTLSVEDIFSNDREISILAEMHRNKSWANFDTSNTLSPRQQPSLTNSIENLVNDNESLNSSSDFVHVRNELPESYTSSEFMKSHGLLFNEDQAAAEELEQEVQQEDENLPTKIVEPEFTIPDIPNDDGDMISKSYIWEWIQNHIPVREQVWICLLISYFIGLSNITFIPVILIMYLSYRIILYNKNKHIPMKRSNKGEKMSDRTQTENGEWFNRMFIDLWKNMIWSNETNLKSLLLYLLDTNFNNSSKPFYITHVTVTDVKLGDVPPIFSRFKASNTNHADSRVDLDIKYYGTARLTLEVGIGCKYVYIKVPIVVDEISIKGRMRFDITFFSKHPFIRAVSFSFLTPPKLDGSIKPFDMMNVMILPGMSDWIIETLLSIMDTSMVLPNQVSVPYHILFGLSEEVDSLFVSKESTNLLNVKQENLLVHNYEIEKSKESGQLAGLLHVHVLHARKLLIEVTRNTSMPYVLLSSGPHEIFSTTSVKRSKKPVWNEFFELLVKKQLQKKVEITVMARDQEGDTLIGVGQLYFSNIGKESKEVIVPITYEHPKKGKILAGEIVLQVRFVSDLSSSQTSQ